MAKRSFTRAKRWTIPAGVAAIATAVSLGGFLPSASAATVTGSITTTDLVQHGRLRLLPNFTSTCANPTAANQFGPAAAPYFYDAYRYQNVGRMPSCATLQLSTTAPGCSVMAAAYSAFDPNTVTANQLGSSGLRATVGEPRTFGVLLQPGQRMTVVVTAANSGATCGSYTLTVNGSTKPGVIPIS